MTNSTLYPTYSLIHWNFTVSENSVIKQNHALVFQLDKTH